jgi:hypothetical protein
MRRSFGVSHVLITTDPRGPEWQLTLELAKGLRQLGVRTSLAAVAPPLPSQAENAVAIPDLNLHFNAESGQNADWMLFLEGRADPDLIHLFPGSTASLAWRKPTLWSMLHDEDELGLLNSHNIVAFPTHHAASKAEVGNAVVVHPGLEADAYRWTQNRELVFATGSDSDIPLLAKVAADQPWPIYLNGVSRLQENVPNIIPVGKIHSSALPAWCGRSPVYLHCGTDELFPIPVLEAAFCNCALVLPDTPSLRELWDRAALFFDPGDANTLAAALSQVVEDEGIRHYYRMRARERAASFTTQAMAQNYLFAYQDMLQTSGLDLASEGQISV